MCSTGAEAVNLAHPLQALKTDAVDGFDSLRLITLLSQKSKSASLPLAHRDIVNQVWTLVVIAICSHR
jgi:hypothetical protein